MIFLEQEGEIETLKGKGFLNFLIFLECNMNDVLFDTKAELIVKDLYIILDSNCLLSNNKFCEVLFV